MAKYKVGDKVRVIANGESDKRYWMEDKSAHNSMVDKMLNFCGKVVTIESVTHQYHIKECGFGWVDEMFEGLAEETPREFKVGDRVKCIKKNWGAEVGALGTVISMDNGVGVEFDEKCDGHDCGCGKYGHCWWVTAEELELVKEEPKAEPTHTPVVNVNVTVNLYENACWYCRKGGLVDLYLAGAMGICPSCGRVCNNNLPTKAKKESIVIEFKPSKPKENKPLTTEELKALPDGAKVFTVWCNNGEGVETWDKPYTTWRTKKGKFLKWSNGLAEIDENEKWYKAYLEEPKRPKAEPWF